MPRNKRKRTESLSRRLAGYSITAGAAALCAGGVELTGSMTADAAITPITSVTPIQETFHSTFKFGQQFTAGPFNMFFDLKNIGTTSASAFVDFNVSSGNPLRIGGNNASIAFKFPQSVLLSGGGVPFGYYAVMLGRNGNGAGSFGSFAPGSAPNAAVTGYIGLKKVSGSHTYYGWLRAQVKNDANGIIGQLAFVADGDGNYGAWGLKGDGVTTGVVPEPSAMALGGLGLLALGAAGVREMRRRKQSVRTS